MVALLLPYYDGAVLPSGGEENNAGGDASPADGSTGSGPEAVDLAAQDWEGRTVLHKVAQEGGEEVLLLLRSELKVRRG